MSRSPAARPAARTRHLVVAALLAALTAGSAWMNVPFGPVPVTLQTTFVLLAGLVLSPSYAAVSMALYLAMGAAGLPVFAGAQAGLGVLLGPTGGFLWAFPLAAAAVSGVYRGLGATQDHGWVWVVKAACAVVAGEVIIYGIGIPWLMAQTGMTLPQALAAALLPFIVPDAIKALIAVVVARAVDRSVAR